MAKRITDEQKTQINELYSKYKNKTKVAKEMGISIASVNKYIITDKPKEEKKDTKRYVKQEMKDPKDFDFIDLVWLVDNEQEEMREL